MLHVNSSLSLLSLVKRWKNAELKEFSSSTTSVWQHEDSKIKTKGVQLKAVSEVIENH